VGIDLAQESQGDVIGEQGEHPLCISAQERRIERIDNFPGGILMAYSSRSAGVVCVHVRAFAWLSLKPG
jgi:hypothetical protein